MASDDASLTTLQSGRRPPPKGAPGVPVLTIAHHPDPRRVGERALVPSTAFELSRHAPEFFGAESPEGRSLAERHLSRTPIRFARESGEIRIDCSDTSTSLRIDGIEVEDEAGVEEARLDVGVVLELGGRVVLVLHRSSRVKLDTPRDGMVGVSDEIARVREEVGKVAKQDVPVLLLGESGTGKELAARAVHERSPRKHGPFVALNMAALADTTAISELFGHEAGAFTGADRRREGCFAQANGGTLFLDEIGAASLDVQAMLLRTLETSEVRPVGANRVDGVDVRIIAATDLDLEHATREGSFRLPLLHRLAVYPIELAPLRRRRSDVGPLIFHFLRQELNDEEEARLLGEESAWLPARLVAELVGHRWPGNVRQLRNAVQQLVIANRDAPEAAMGAALERELAERSSEADPEGPAIEAAPAPAARGRADLTTFTDEQVLESLRKNRFKVAATARALGISKHSMYQLMDRSDRIRKAKDLSEKEIRDALVACGGDLEAASLHLEVSRRGLRLRMTDLGITAPGES